LKQWIFEKDYKKKDFFSSLLPFDEKTQHQNKINKKVEKT